MSIFRAQATPLGGMRGQRECEVISLQALSIHRRSRGRSPMGMYSRYVLAIVAVSGNRTVELMVLLIVFVTLALSFSFLCSVLEAVLLSISPSYIAAESQRGHPGGRLWKRYKADIDRPLAAILSLNTIAHTVGAAGAGAQATRVFGEAYFGIASAVLTLLILVLSEIIPKTLGAVYWRQLAPVSAQLLRLVIWTMYPLVVMAQVLTRLLSRGSSQHSISREEFAALAEVGVKEGVFTAQESELVRSMLRFRSLSARDIMTPRPVIFSLPEAASIEEVLYEYSPIRFSRIPVYGEHRDDINGFIRKDDLLMAATQSPPGTTLAALRREILAVPETLSLTQLLRRMTASRNHIAVVVNEYGDVLGIVTMEDLVETMLGLEIVDETDSCPDMQTLARELWLKRARELGIVPETFVEKTGQVERDGS